MVSSRDSRTLHRGIPNSNRLKPRADFVGSGFQPAAGLPPGAPISAEFVNL
jgi:hypothetical protein